MALQSAVSHDCYGTRFVSVALTLLITDLRGRPRRGDRFDDRRGGAYGGNWRRNNDDYRYGRYDSYGDRSRDYGYRDYRDYGRRDYRDDYGYRGGVDRYASGRDDRYSREDRGDRRRGYYDRDANPPSYDQGPPVRDAYSSRTYEPRDDDRYAR